MPQSAILSDPNFTLKGNLDELARLVAETAAFCRQSSLGIDVEFDLTLALDELFTNAVRHGGCAGLDDAVRVGLTVAGDAVQVEFRDRGNPFDPRGTPPPKLDGPLEERGGGLGLHLVRQVMSDFHYERAGEWNRITMRRPLAGA